jgi:hypothetical protein
MSLSASSWAKASPIPDEAPVTTAHGPNLATKLSIVASLPVDVQLKLHLSRRYEISVQTKPIATITIKTRNSGSCKLRIVVCTTSFQKKFGLGLPYLVRTSIPGAPFDSTTSAFSLITLSSTMTRNCFMVVVLGRLFAYATVELIKKDERAVRRTVPPILYCRQRDK